jgi:hypothetical protein
MAELSKPAALALLFAEARREKSTATNARIAVRACRALGLTHGEMLRTLSLLDFCDVTGTPYAVAQSNLTVADAQRIWMNPHTYDRLKV